MNPAPTLGADWTRRRFWSVAGILFVAQAGLILLCGARYHSAPGAVAAACQFRVLDSPLTADQLSKMFFAGDPDVFPLPSPHGFSGRAWLDHSAQQIEAPEQTQTPAWLAMDTGRLGTNFPSLNGAKTPLPSPDEAGQEFEPWPAFLAPETFHNQSVFRVRGTLAGRLLNAPASLPAWPSAQLLGRTVVQIAVDSAGQVVAARLQDRDLRSGSAEADLDALTRARALRFRPVPASAPVWGDALFDWQTIEPTNGPPAGAP